MTNSNFNAQEEIGSALQFRISKLLSKIFPENHSVCEYKTDEQLDSVVLAVQTESDDHTDTSNPSMRARVHVYVYEIDSPSDSDSEDQEEFYNELRENVTEGTDAHSLIEKLIQHPDLLHYVAEYGEYESTINPLPTF